ncbi:MAG TPA: AlkA N-terminal domain-containing protein [Steroidobacteraceae bacterium]|nr:AlkA N-terminal domain-containing protein [Steroidobacteraceae bacterium]
MREVQGFDRRSLDAARISRDARFDGRFFIAVRTTGIYCRPICPAPRCKSRNVRYYPSAAAAASAGFRPCLRCRPEAAPGTPAWIGTSAVVRRALRLIHEGTLDEDSVEDLALRVGVGARQLHRLFLTHVGASPVAVAQTRRLHFAKRLLDETSLPMTELALAAGYGSLRRFNHAFRETYGKPPRELRKARKAGLPAIGADEVALRLAYRPPYDWSALAADLAARATPGVERVDRGSYARALRIGKGIATLRVETIGGENALLLRVRGAPASALLSISASARRVFDLAADPASISATLGRDRAVAAALRRRPGLRIGGAWDPFECAVRAISGAYATARIAREFGDAVPQNAEGLRHLFPLPAALVGARFRGLARAPADSLRTLARRAADGTLDFDGPVETLLGELAAIGGERLAQTVALFALGEPDALPEPALAARAEAWRPWRSYGYLAGLERGA